MPIFQFWFIGLLILINYVLSLTYLFHQGKITTNLTILNFIQLILFCNLHYLINSELGVEHYSYMSEPYWYDWVQLVAVHVLRAVDLLDIIGAYGIHLQNVIHQSLLAGMILFSMHIIVDIFLLGAVFMLISRRSAGQQAATLMKMQRFTIRFQNILIFFNRIRLWAFLLALVLIIGVGIEQRWSFNNWLLWPVDNILRTLDFGDAFQIFGWQLHSIEMGLGLATLAVFFRLVVSFYAFGPFNRFFLFLLGGRGKTIEELVRISNSSEYSEEEVEVAFRALLRFDTKTVVPHLITIMNEGQLHFRRLAIEDLEEKGILAAQAIPSLVMVLSDNNSELRLAADHALNNINPQWQQDKTIKNLVPKLVDKLLNSKRKLQRALILSTLKTIEPKNEKTMLLLLQALDKNEAIRIVAIETLGNMGKIAKIIPKLLKILKNDVSSQVRITVLDALENIKPIPVKNLPYFIKVLNEDSSPEVRKKTVKILGTTNVKILPYLAKALIKDNSASVRQAIVEEFDNMKAIKTVPYLVMALVDIDINVRKAAFSTLKNIAPKWYNNKAILKLIPRFIKILADNNENPERRIAAIFVLYKTTDLTNVIASLKYILSDKNSKMRRVSLLALGRVKLIDIVPEHPFELLTNEEAKVRRTAFLVLKRNNINSISERILDELIRNMTYKNVHFEIRYDIAKAIDTLKLITWSPKIVTYLLDILLDKRMNSIAISIFKLVNDIEPQWAEITFGLILDPHSKAMNIKTYYRKMAFYSLVESFKKRKLEFDYLVNHGFLYLRSYQLHYGLGQPLNQDETLYKEIIDGLVKINFFNIETINILNKMGYVVGIAIMLAITTSGYVDSVKNIAEREDIMWKIENSIKILDPENKWRNAYYSHINNMRMDW